MSKTRGISYLLLLCLLGLLLWTRLSSASTTAATLDWWFLGGSGGHVTISSGALQGTLGQPLANLTINTNNTVCAGFWCGIRREYASYLPFVIRWQSGGAATHYPARLSAGFGGPITELTPLGAHDFQMLGRPQPSSPRVVYVARKE